jgi:ComF family protein
MAEFVEKYVEMKRYNWFIPVPLHRVKHRERTFNQAEVLAAHLSRRFNIPMLKRNIVRIRLGTPQVMSPKSKRLEDIKDSFKTKNSHLLKNTSVLLIDDVFTTGATANECSKVLKKAGVNRVDVLTLARSI